MGLPGFQVEFDVESTDFTTDIDIRRADPSETGRLLATNTGFTAFGSGPDLGYVFDPNTQYTIAYTITRTAADALDIRVDFGDNTHTSTDVTPISYSFGMLAMGASTGAFGSTNVVGADPFVINDNGIDIDSFSVEFIPNDPDAIDDPDDGTDDGIDDAPEVTSVVDDIFSVDGTDPTISSTSPNISFEGLPGFYLELDVESADPSTDLDLRRSDPSLTGRSLSTSTGFSSLGNGPNIGYIFEPDTQYTVVLKVARTATDTLDITASFAGSTFTVTDTIPASFNFGMLAMNVSSGAFGSSNVPGDLDNGLDLNSFSVEVGAVAGGGVIIDDGPEGTGAGSDVTASLVSDDFVTNGTAGAETSYFSSNSGSAIEFNTDSIGLVSGSSGRQIHSLFPTQSLDQIGDTIRATLSFTTPDTVSTGGDDIRIGLFDHLGRDSATELGANTTFNSSEPSPLYMDLPGYYVEIDVDQFSTSTDLEIGISNPTTTGRLLNTTNGFTRSNGESIAYAILPNTDYTVYLEVERGVKCTRRSG